MGKREEKKLTAIIGLNGAGKTSFLEMIDNTLSKTHLSFISKYFSSADQNLLINQEEYKILNDKLCANASRFKSGFIGFVYDSINDFSLLQYFDYFFLIGFKWQDFNAIPFEYKFCEFRIEQRILEKKKFLFRFEDGFDLEEETVDPSPTYYSKNKLNKIKPIEYYLKLNKSHKLSPGEYLMLLIQLWIMHTQKVNRIKKLRILLLDEPDTYMHPKLIKKFVDLLQSKKLDCLNLHIIFTTHNPVTVNFLDIDHIYELKIDDNENRSIGSIDHKSKLIHHISGYRKIHEQWSVLTAVRLPL